MSGYRSPRRRQQAEATRDEILRAARRLFAEHGYGATSMADVAAAAGVAVQTIYAGFRSKRGLVEALVDLIDREADVSAVGAQLAASEDAAEIVRLGVRLTRQVNQRCGDIIGALLSAAEVEADVAPAAAEGARRHRAGAEGVGRRLAALGALRDGLTEREAAALIAVLTWHPAYAQLTRDHGWSFDECERRIGDALVAALLR